MAILLFLVASVCNYFGFLTAFLVMNGTLATPWGIISAPLLLLGVSLAVMAGMMMGDD